MKTNKCITEILLTRGYEISIKSWCHHYTVNIFKTGGGVIGAASAPTIKEALNEVRQLMINADIVESGNSD